MKLSQRSFSLFARLDPESCRKEEKLFFNAHVRALCFYYFDTVKLLHYDPLYNDIVVVFFVNVICAYPSFLPSNKFDGGGGIRRRLLGPEGMDHTCAAGPVFGLILSPCMHHTCRPPPFPSIPHSDGVLRHSTFYLKKIEVRHIIIIQIAMFKTCRKYQIIMYDSSLQIHDRSGKKMFQIKSNSTLSPIQ